MFSIQTTLKESDILTQLFTLVFQYLPVHVQCMFGITVVTLKTRMYQVHLDNNIIMTIKVCH